MSDLTFKELREANVKRRGSAYDCEDWTGADWMTALVGEVGELANFQKKYRRGDLSTTDFYDVAWREIADIQTYLDLYAEYYGIDLADATVRKFNEVSDRMGSRVEL